MDVDGVREDRGAYIYNGIANGGFDIGLQEDFVVPDTYHDARIELVFEQKYAITHWLVAGVQKGYVIGPFLLHQIPAFLKPFKLSPLFTVPKPNEDDLVKKYRIIHHLSHPSGELGTSVNDLVADAWKHVRYTAFKEVVEMAFALGPRAWLWAVDAQDAYYRVPIKQKYWSLFAILWLGRYFFFTSLQMGLANACKIYTRFADAIEFIISKNHLLLFKLQWDGRSIRILRHYLDDFFGGHKRRCKARRQFVLVQQWMAALGIPTKPSKCIEPARVQRWLGWLYNTLTQTLAVPSDKVERYIARIDAILHKEIKV